MRLEPDRRHLTLPVIGKLRSKENTRRLERLLAKGQAQVLSMTLSEQAGRLFVSVGTIVAQASRRPSEPHARCGVDLGIGAEWAVVAHADDTIERISHPAPWTAVQQQRRRLARHTSRRVVGSRGHRQAKAKLAALDGARPTCAANPSTPSPPGWPVATGRSSSKTSTLPRWARHGSAGVPAQRVPGWARPHPSPPWPTRPAGRAASWSWPTAGWPPPRLTMAAEAYLADLSLGQRVWVCSGLRPAGGPQCQRGVEPP